MNEYWKYYSEDYQKVLESQMTTTKPPTTDPPKKTFWETGFGTGLSNLWGFVTNNPQQVVNLVAPKRAIVTNPTDPNYLQNGGFVGGNTQNPQPEQPQNNNSALLIIMGVVIVVILFLMFKKQ
ncbi:hypothetical protein GCM10011514_16840 [Emticicia aquatilis]|uniref:Uncharacterized protein n=1 Tax=Emticicia aquatilis TaxID=1537369 RepID=A0A916YN72_9BACT|nr:hypothetical protein [Emticicia aquatilis]GGD53354.1 hypothetical protein GCM10011514_16840 [Emticicia aquatilis]